MPSFSRLFWASTLWAGQFWLIAAALALVGLFGCPCWAADPNHLYGGIEIGSKGVKLAVFELTADGKIVKPKERPIDTNLMEGVSGTNKEFAKKNIDDTVKAVGNLYQELLTLQVPPENIFVVGSSGLLPAEQKSRDTLATEVNAEIAKRDRRDKPVKMTFLKSAEEEVGLQPVSLAKGPKLGSVLQVIIVDFGSGNTKAGLFMRESADKLDWTHKGSWEIEGGKPFAARVEKEVPKDPRIPETGNKKEEEERLSRFATTAANLRPALVKKIEEKIKNVPGWRDRKTPVVMNGGIVWATNAIFKPETVGEAQVALSPQDFVQYARPC